MSTAIVQRQSLTPQTIQVIQSVAPIMKASRLFGAQTDDQAAAIMIKGFELGFSLSASFEYVTVIQGKPVLVPKGMMALIMNSPLYESHSIKEEVDKSGNPYSCTVTMKRVNGFQHTVTFTMDDAKRAGLIKDQGAWTSYPANMLRWRALGYCADIVFPDVIGGMKRADEFGAPISEDGEIEIDTTWTVQPPKSTLSPAVEPEPGAVSLQDLVDQYGADKVMEAAGGKIPGTADEVVAVANALGGA